MFNGLIIRELLRKQNKSEKEFCQFLWPNKKPQIPYLESKKSINTSTLEKLCSFFNCSADLFFSPQPSREGNSVIGDHNNVGNINYSDAEQKRNEQEIAFLKMSLTDKERLIKEKDERIAVLNSYIEKLEKLSNAH